MPNDDERTAAPSTNLLTNPYAIVLWFICCMVLAFVRQPELSVFFGFIFVLTLCAYTWGRYSLRCLEYSMKASKSGVFPDQTVDITRTLYNGKLLPLIWAELLEPCDPNGCLTPDKRFIIKDPTGDSVDPVDPAVAHRCLYTFSMMKWHQALSVTDTWTARRRGIHRISSALLRSGDGFGLCVRSKPALIDPAWTLAVYPRLVDVSVDMVLRDMWDTRSSSYGYLEDISLLKSVRDYLPQDPARRINQRLLARGQGLKINQYEVVTPSAVMFILDAHSFAGQGDALETTLSILASLLVGLCGRGVNSGLAVPASAFFPESCVIPTSSEAELARMLALLAASDSKAKLRRPVPIPAPELIGAVYYIARSAETASSTRLLAPFPQHKTKLLIYEAYSETEGILEIPARSIREFQRNA